MTHPILAFALVVGLRPNTSPAKAVSPKMNSMSQEFVACPAHSGFADLAGLEADWRGPGKALEHLGVTIAFRIGANGRQQPRSQHLFCSRQTAKESMIRMLFE